MFGIDRGVWIIRLKDKTMWIYEIMTAAVDITKTVRVLVMLPVAGGSVILGMVRCCKTVVKFQR